MKNLSTKLYIKKVLKKTSSNIWKKINEGDIIIIDLPIVNNAGGWGRGAHQVYANIFRETSSEVPEYLGKCSMASLYNYVGADNVFDVEEVDEGLIKDIKLYCADLCLTKDPESCETCPLNKYNNF